ncbi:MAG: glycosyltransferase, partial [Bacteroidales bacterium]|nr:glycosyltransferase [Bacteroidales bacterium]
MNPKNSKEEALISVIVPIYNSAAYLEQTFDCLRNQSYRNIEVILIDDGSTDASGRMCDEIAAEDPRFKVIHQKNAGVTAARNAGFELMTGDYLWLPDSDDYFHLDFLRIMYDAINSAPDIDVATCDAAKVFERDCDIRTPLQPSLRVVTQQEIIPNFFIEGAVPYASFAWNKLFRVSSSKGPIHYREYPPCEDADFTLRFFLSTQKAVVVDNVMYYFVQVPGSM